MLAPDGFLQFRPAVGDVGVGTCHTPISEAAPPDQAAASPPLRPAWALSPSSAPPSPSIGPIARAHATTATGMGFGIASSSPLDRGCAQLVVVGEVADTSTAICGHGEEDAKVYPEGRRPGAGDVDHLSSGFRARRSQRGHLRRIAPGLRLALSSADRWLDEDERRLLPELREWRGPEAGRSSRASDGGQRMGAAYFCFALSGPRLLRLLDCSPVLRWTAPRCCSTSVTRGRRRRPWRHRLFFEVFRSSVWSPTGRRAFCRS